MKKTVVLIGIIFCINSLLNGQCNVLKNYRSDGTTVHYLNPEYIGKGTNCELGLSFQTNGENYFLNTTVRYFKNPQKQIEDLKIQLSNNHSLELSLYRSEIASFNNEDVSLGIYYLKNGDIIQLKNSPIKIVLFKESSGNYQIVNVLKNKDCAIRQIHCLELNNF